ncbi:flagellin [Rhodovulum sp. 12E13]|uniref:flagellin n=1 Tax=Rhodovulum sp. 12E13 TaxID=2203891 RepID=UPI000E1552A3|nr:flagellin [Rhodovulum sp. 12E13]RDC74856.1 flagellin [Rhodovulum sp. 12E13]
MSSILTNTGAMTALQTLRGINQNLTKTQDMISTGKKVATAKDNAAIWSISKVMESDVKGFTAISESLSLGQSTVAVARNGSEQVTELLGEIKKKIVAAQEDNVDRAKLQDDLESLRNQVTSIVNAAQFNGQNLLKQTSVTAGDGTMEVLSSLDRNASGGVGNSTVDVTKRDLSVDAEQAVGSDGAGTAVDLSDAKTVADGDAVTAVTDSTGQDAVAGAQYSATIGGLASQTYVARDGDTFTDVYRQLAARLNAAAGEAGEDLVFSIQNGELALQNNSGTDVTIAANDIQGDNNTDGTAGGGLELLDDLDISTETGAAGALGAIDGLIEIAVGAASEFGVSERRLEIQNDFVSRLSDSLKSGIGALVDADMEEASARLQALQVQQQLGVQALSIANQAPQNILALFR